uniref:Polyneuridine-aldehyde esterase n=1 Tax=Gymnema sylvestre TaxID=4068 RepID=A0AA49C1Y9_GYMSY|nr:polyneuridine-aldehyde esterase [Gymnema sylvestre]
MVVTADHQKHFVLVHGVGHGAWSWFKIKQLLEEAGHRVTAVDLAASGTNTNTRLEDLHTVHDYSKPLLKIMSSIIPADEKVVLVGHSYGGINMALAMDEYPEKVSVAVYVSALMPDAIHAPSYVLDEYLKWIPEGHMIDTQFLPYAGISEDQETSVLFGHKYISTKLYHKCSNEDIALAKMLVRPMSLFTENLSEIKPFPREGYGSVKRVYITCNEDKAVPLEFQQWLIENIGVAEVIEMKNADHNPMFSQPHELCRYLLEIAERYI